VHSSRSVLSGRRRRRRGGERGQHQRHSVVVCLALTSARRENNNDDRGVVLVVTGCLGFIGSHFCERVLANTNARVIGIDRADVDLGPYKKEHKRANLEHLMRIGKWEEDDNASIEDKFTFIEEDILALGVDGMLEQCGTTAAAIDGVVHCAALSGVRDTLDDPTLAFRANVETTAIAIEFAKRREANFVFLSSGATYGDNADKIASRECEGVMGASSMATSPYAFSKIAGEAVVRSYARAFEALGKKITIARIFTCFGNRGRPDMAITRFFCSLLDDGGNEGEEKKLTMFGDGDDSWRDYCHVSDVCSGIEKALWREKGSTCEAINISRGEAVSLRRLMTSVQRAASEELKSSSDDDVKIVVEPKRPGDVGGTFADVSKAKNLLDWEAEISLEEGLASVAKWYNSAESKTQFR
jgi:UDP-glucuronate 4-epimerase